MEVGTIQNNKGNLFLAEFLGSLFFISAIFYTALFHGKEPLTTAVGVGIGLFIAITAFGKYTGGHFNPAVSTGYFFFIQTEKLAHAYTYFTLMAGQFLGGMAAGLLLFIVTGFDNPVLLPKEDNILGAFIDESFFSFMFMTVIFCIKSSKHNFTQDSMLGGLTVGITLSGCVLYGGQVSGACYNPAVGFALNFWATMARGDTAYMKYLFMYMIAPTIGSLVAGFLVRFYIDSAFTPHVEPLQQKLNEPFLYRKDNKDLELQTTKN